MSNKGIKVEVAENLFTDEETGEMVYQMFEVQNPYNEDRDLVHVEYRSPEGIPIIEEHIEEATHDFMEKLALVVGQPLTPSIH